MRVALSAGLVIPFLIDNHTIRVAAMALYYIILASANEPRGSRGARRSRTGPSVRCPDGGRWRGTRIAAAIRGTWRARRGRPCRPELRS